MKSSTWICLTFTDHNQNLEAAQLALAQLKKLSKLRNDQTHKEDRVTRFSINTSVLTIVDGCGKQITVGITLMPEESTDL